MAPVAQASSFPDLPGMESAEEATGGSAEVEEAGSAPSNAKTQDEAPALTKAAKQTTTDQDTSSITEMPGGGAIPAMDGGDTAGLASTSAVTGNAGLIGLAGLGSFAALAWLFYLRRAGVL